HTSGQTVDDGLPTSAGMVMQSSSTASALWWCLSVRSSCESEILMKAIFAALILAAVSATPATAKHKGHPQTYSQNSYTQPGDGPGVFSASPRNWQPDPYGVYVGGSQVGRDPDPNVRQLLERDYNYMYGGR